MRNMVSVIVPVYNAERYLEQCVRSLKEQTCAGIEIILVDDGSTDGSLALCRRLAHEDQRICVYHHSNRGPSATRNEGIRHAHGEWIMFADADDWLETDAIACMLDAAAQTQAELVIGGYGRFEDGQSEDRSVHLISNEALSVLDGAKGVAQLLVEPRTSLAGVSVWAKLYRRELIVQHDITFPEHISYEEDCCFNLQYYRSISRTAVLGRCVYHYRQTPVSLSKRYRTESFSFLLNGYRERCRFFAEIGLQHQRPALDAILLIVMLTAFKKIAIASGMTVWQKYHAYASIIREREIQRTVRCVRPPDGRLMKAVVYAVRNKCAMAVQLLMEMWLRRKG